MEEYRILVKAGPHDRENCPLNVTVKSPGVNAPSGLLMVDEETGERVPAQLELIGDSRVRVHWILKSLRKFNEKEYTVRFNCESDDLSGLGVNVKEAEGKLDVYVNGEPFMSYNYLGVVRPYIHPVIGPEGRRVTRNFPMIPDVEGETRDHQHHRSIWTAHGDVNGVDNWSELPGHGRILHRSFKSIIEGPVYGEFKAENIWVSNSGVKVLDEERRITVYNTPEDSRMMELEVKFKATNGDVRFGDTKEGGIISIRVATSMDVVNGGRIENSYGGINEEETWGKRAHWCDYSGPVKGLWVGIAVFDHPSNLRHPTYWHVRNYGLMTANPFGISYFTGNPKMDGSFTLKRGEELTFRYRVFIHKGDAGEGKVKERYHDFINPPKISVK